MRVHQQRHPAVQTSSWRVVLASSPPKNNGVRNRILSAHFKKSTSGQDGGLERCGTSRASHSGNVHPLRNPRPRGAFARARFAEVGARKISCEAHQNASVPSRRAQRIHAPSATSPVGIFNLFPFRSISPGCFPAFGRASSRRVRARSDGLSKSHPGPEAPQRRARAARDD